jgi:acid stress-induced BolA-like protein IbaG/YrbA
MSTRSFFQVLGVAGLCVGAMIAPAGAASAAASVTRFTFSETETFADAPPECMPVVKSGVTTATESGSGQITQTPNGGFADGSYLTGVGHGHFSVVVNTSRTVQTNVVREPRTIYSADGTAIGTVMIHALTHTTTNNVTGETTASIDKFFFTCS